MLTAILMRLSDETNPGKPESDRFQVTHSLDVWGWARKGWGFLKVPAKVVWCWTTRAFAVIVAGRKAGKDVKMGGRALPTEQSNVSPSTSERVTH